MRIFAARQLQRITLAALGFYACGVARAQPTEADVRRAITRLDSGDWIERWGAMQVLGESKSNEAIAPLRRLHADERQDAWVRGRSLVALAQIQPTVILPVAARLAEDSKDQELQAAAVEALGVAGMPRGKEPLLKALQSDSPPVRDAAIEAYARVAGAEAVSFIDAALRSKEPDAVRHAVRGLSYIDTPDARSRLWALIAGEDERAALEAAGAADRLQLPGAVPGLLRAAANPQREQLAAMARRALIRYPETMLAAPLADALRGGDHATRKAVLSVLEERPVAAAVQAVADLAATGSLDAAALAESLELMGRSDAVRFREAFIAQLDHESSDVRRAAAGQLGRTGADAFTLLKPLLEDPEAAVRAEAIQALRRSESTTPQGGIVAYLRSTLQQTQAVESSSLLALLAQRLAAGERDAAIEAIAPFLANAQSRNDAYVVASRVADDDASRRAVAAAMGYVVVWRMVGPFGDTATGAERIEQPLPPEDSPNEPRYRDGDRELAWVTIDRPGVDGGFDPGNVPEIVGDERRGGIVVATAVIEAPAATSARLTLNANGAAVVVSLNDQRVASRRERAEIAEDVQLNAGANRLVIKLGGQAEQWIFSTRLSDAVGNALPGVTTRPQ